MMFDECVCWKVFYIEGVVVKLLKQEINLSGLKEGDKEVMQNFVFFFNRFQVNGKKLLEKDILRFRRGEWVIFMF